MDTQSEPTAARPNFPGYGIEQGTEGMLSWEHVREQMAASRNYWICSTRPDGRPHAAPVWGVWLDDVLCFGTNPASVKGRNLAANPVVAIHLESGDDCVIFEGAVELMLNPDPAWFARYADAYHAKYNFRPEPGHYVLRPRVAFAWLEKDYPKTATRWTFDGH